MRLALDRHYAPTIAEQLRVAGHDVVAAVERGWEQEDDDSLLEICDEDNRALLSNNVGDFVTIARTWAAEGRSHAGLIFTSDSSMPRGRRTIGRYLEALEEILQAHPGDEALRDQVLWL
ncbi:MAG: DUF5615 family PIN-like protein [Actinomycetota bacterium]|nr:DUF5615 family PIN-like protein [Actinomycetota bacterium]